MRMLGLRHRCLLAWPSVVGDRPTTHRSGSEVLGSNQLQAADLQTCLRRGRQRVTFSQAARCCATTACSSATARTWRAFSFLMRPAISGSTSTRLPSNAGFLSPVWQSSGKAELWPGFCERNCRRRRCSVPSRQHRLHHHAHARTLGLGVHGGGGTQHGARGDTRRCGGARHLAAHAAGAALHALVHEALHGCYAR